VDHSWASIRRASSVDRVEIALMEIDVAIALVERGLARRIRLCGLQAIEHAAGPGLARAQAAGVAFSLERDPAPNGAVSIVIGPALE